MANSKQFTLKVDADVSAAQKKMSELMNSLTKVSKLSFDSAFANDDFIKADQAAQSLTKHLQEAVNVDTGKLNLTVFNQSLKSSGQSLASLSQDLLSIGSAGQAAFLNLATAISQSEVPLKRVNTMMSNWMTTLKNTVKWEMSSTMVHGLESALSGAVTYAKDLNSSLTNIRIVTGQSIDQMARFTVEANRAAKSLATTTKAYTDASLIYYQQGDNAATAAKKAEITLKAANSSFNTSAAEMSEYLTAVWNSYQVGADELERYVDIMAALGAKTATSLEEIATSMQKVAATSNTVGVSMEQVSSIIATVSSVTRESAESIGTSYKTIFARMGDLKLGKTDADGIGLGQVSSQLESIGVQVLDASGNLRDMGDIITDLGNKWQTMNSAQKTAVAQVVAGKRQYTQLMALFENWDMYNTNLGFAQDAKGSLQSMQDVYAQSWEAASKRVKASLEGIYNQLIDDQSIIKFTNGLADAVGVVEKLVHAFGGLPGILGTIGSLVTRVFSSQMTTGISTFLQKTTNYFQQLPKVVKNQALNIGTKFSNTKEWAVSKITGRQFTKKETRDTNILTFDQQNAQALIQKQRNELNKQNPTTAYEGAVIENSKTLLSLKSELINKENALSAAQKERASAALADLSNEYQALERVMAETEQLTKSLSTTPTSFYQSFLGTANKNSKDKHHKFYQTSGDVRQTIDNVLQTGQNPTTMAKLRSQVAQNTAAQLTGQNFLMRAQAGFTDSSAKSSFLANVDNEIANAPTTQIQEMFQAIREMATTGTKGANEVTAMLNNLGDTADVEKKFANGKWTEAQLQALYGEVIGRGKEIGTGLSANRLREYALQGQAEKTKSNFSKMLTGQDLGNKTGYDKVAAGLTTAAQAAMSLTSSMSLGANLAETFGDNMATTGDKITGVVSAVGNVASAFATGGLIGGISAVLGTAISAVVEWQEQIQKKIVATATTAADSLKTQITEFEEMVAEQEQTTQEYLDLQEAKEDASISQSEYISRLGEIASSLQIEGGEVLALAGNYRELEDAIEGANKARVNDRVEQAQDIMDSTAAGAANMFIAESSKGSGALSLTVHDTKFEIASFFEKIWNSTKKNEAVKKAEKDHDGNGGYEYIASLFGDTIYNAGAHTRGPNLEFSKDFNSLLALYNQMLEIEKQAKTDAAVNTIFATPEMQELFTWVKNTIDPYYSGMDAKRAAQAEYIGLNRAEDFNNKTLAEQKTLRNDLYNQLIESWGLTPSTITNEDRDLAYQLLDKYLVQYNKDLSTNFATLDLATKNEQAILQAGATRNKNFNASWLEGVSLENLANINANILDYSSQEAFQKSLSLGAKVGQKRSKLTTAASLLTGLNEEEYDLDTWLTQAAKVLDIQNFDVKALDQTEKAMKLNEFQTSLRNQWSTWENEFNAAQAGNAEYITTALAQEKEYEKRFIRYNRRTIESPYTSSAEIVAHKGDYDNLLAYQKNEQKTGADLATILTSMGYTPQEQYLIYRSAKKTPGQPNATSQEFLSVDNFNYDWSQIDETAWQTEADAKVWGDMANRVAYHQKGLYTSNTVDGNGKWEDIVLSAERISALTSSQNILRSDAYRLTPEEERALIKTQFNDAANINLNSLSWADKDIAKNLVAMGFTNFDDALDFLGGDKLLGMQTQLKTMRELRAKAAKDSSFDSATLAQWDVQIADLQDNLNAMYVTEYSNALTVVQRGWTNIGTAASSAGSTISNLLKDLSSWTTLSAKDMTTLENQFKILGMDFDTYSKKMTTALTPDANGKVDYETAGLTSMKAMTDITLKQNEALEQQSSLYESVIVTAEKTKNKNAIVNKEFLGYSDTIISDEKKGLLNKLIDEAITNLGFENTETNRIAHADEILAEVARLAKESNESVELDILLNTANLKEGWQTALADIYAQEQAAAQEVYNLWATTFEAISAARKGLASGQSIIETLYGNPEELKAIIALMREAGMSSTAIHKALNDNTYDASKLKMEDFNADNYGKGLHATGDALVGTTGYVRTYDQYKTLAERDIRENEAKYIKSLTDENKEQLVKDGILTATKDDDGKTSYQVADMNKFIAEMLMTEKEYEKAATDVIAQKEIQDYQDKAADADTAKAKRDETIEKEQEKVDEATAMRDAANKAWQDKAAGTSITDSLRASNVNLEEFAKLAGVSVEDLDKLTFDQLDTVAKAQQGIIETSQESMKTAATDYQTTIDGLGLANTQYGEEAEKTVENLEDKITTFSNKVATDDAANIKAMADAVGMTKDEFEAFAQQLEQNDPTTTLGKNMYEVAYITAKASKALSEFDSSAKDLFKTLKKGKKDTNEYIKAMSSIKKNVADIFNVDEGLISDEFIETNMDNLNKLVNGTEKEAKEAAQALQDALMDELVTKENIIPIEFHADADKILNQVNGILDQLSAKDVAIGTQIDTGPALAGLNSLLASGQITADGISAALNGIGWTPEISYDSYPIESYDAVSGTVRVPNADGTYSTLNASGGVVTSTHVLIPRIGSMAKTGTGVSTPNLGSSGGGGGGGGEPEKLDTKDPVDEKERYHEINKDLENLAKQLEKVDKAKTATYGGDHLKELQKEIDLLEEEGKAYQLYLEEAQAYLESDRAKLEAEGAVFDADGDIDNYDELIDSWVAQYNAFIEKYNAASSSEQKKMKEEKEDWDEWYEDRLEMIEKYEESLDTVLTQENNILQNRLDLSAAHLEAVQYKIEYQVEINDDELSVLEYFDELYEEIVHKQGTRMSNLMTQATQYEDNLHILGEARKELDALYAAGELTDADYVSGLRDINEQVIENLESLEDVKESITELYEDTLELIDDELEEQEKHIESAAEAMESYLTLMGLMGRGENYRELEQFYEKQAEFMFANLQNEKSHLDFLMGEKEYYDSIIASGRQLSELEQEQYDALLTAIDEANEELLKSTEEMLKLLEDKYKNTVSAILDELDTQLAGMQGLDHLAEQFSYFEEEQERYVTSARELYEVSKLNRQINDSIASNTSKASKEMLRQLRERINAQSELNDLTEYDIEMYQLQYELALRKIALEEAQNAKDTIRLTRDENGNMVYQYTANEDKISQAQQDYEDTLQEINDLTANRINELYSLRIEAMQQLEDDLEEIANNTQLSEEERNQLMAEAQERFAARIGYVSEQYTNASENFAESNAAISAHYGEDLAGFAETSRANIEATMNQMMTSTTDTMAQVQTAIGNLQTAWWDHTTAIADVSAATGTSYDEMIAKVDKYSEAVSRAKLRNDEFIKSLGTSEEGLMAEIHNASEAWNDYATALQSVVDKYQAIIDKTTAVITAIANANAATQDNKPNNNNGGTGNNGGTPVSNPSSNNSGGNSGNGGNKPKGYKIFYNSKQLSSTMYDNYGAASSAIQTGINNRATSLAQMPASGQYYAIAANELHEWRNAVPRAQYLHGGLADFTGPAWLDGTKSNPELVLNATDTQNMLAAVSAIRDLDLDTIMRLRETINLATMSMLSNLQSAQTTGALGLATSGTLDQTVTIHAEFPNVQDKNEIMDAIDDLVNRASQYSQKRMS